MNPHDATELHLDAVRRGLDEVQRRAGELDDWAAALLSAFDDGGRLLVAGNGGSAALAAHLTGELVGRFLDERRPFPALWLGADQAALTAILNDYGATEVFARQVHGFATPRDVVLLLSTSGRSANLISAVDAARTRGATVWALTGAAPNPLHGSVDRCVACPGPTPVVQDLHQVVVHLLCAAFDRHLVQQAVRA